MSLMTQVPSSGVQKYSSPLVSVSISNPNCILSLAAEVLGRHVGADYCHKLWNKTVPRNENIQQFICSDDPSEKKTFISPQCSCVWKLRAGLTGRVWLQFYWLWLGTAPGFTAPHFSSVYPLWKKEGEEWTMDEWVCFILIFTPPLFSG